MSSRSISYSMALFRASRTVISCGLASPLACRLPDDTLATAVRRAASCAVRATDDEATRGRSADDEGDAALLCSERLLHRGRRARAVRAAAIVGRGSREGGREGQWMGEVGDRVEQGGAAVDG